MGFSVKFQYLSWLLIISLCIPSPVAYGIGVNIPTIASTLLKAACGVAINSKLIDASEFISQRNQFKTSSKVSSTVVNCPIAQIKEPQESILASIVVMATFIAILAWNINNSKKMQKQCFTDKQKIEEVEKA